MAGGTFDKLAGKVRPGTYINFESTRQETVGNSERGTVLIPLIGHNFGPAKEFISLSAASPDAQRLKLGYSVYDDNKNMLLIREAFKKASTVIVFITESGNKATQTSGELTITAKYGGTRGNDIHVSIIANPTGEELFDVSVYLDTEKTASYEGVKTCEELIAAAANDALVTFEGSGDLAAAAGVKLENGTDTQSTTADVTGFLDRIEGVKWNTLCFPVTETQLHTAVLTKIKYMRENMGRGVQAVVPNMKTPDYEGIINVTNSVVVDGKALSAAEACAWVAAATAAASCTKSNTYEIYSGATEVVDPKDNEKAIAAINAGEFFFSVSEEGNVVVEYDINSLVTFTKPKDSTYRKNRVIRVFDSFAETVQLNFPPNKYDNDPTGWEVMEGIGKTILKQYGPRPDGIGAIKNVDFDNDFLVDQSLSEGDQTFFIVGLEAVDSSEKLYFTIKTR